jgi:hypothetical protein
MGDSDNYSSDILRQRYNGFKDSHINLLEINGTKKLGIRCQNPPEDITENIVKFIMINYDNDPTCKWAKSVGKNGDLYSEKYSADSPPEVKAFMSNGPCSFGPTKKFGVIYFLDMRLCIKDTLICWRVNVSDESPEWRQMKMNKNQTYEQQCNEKRRPHISWDNIHSQISEKCVKVYEGTFEGIFMQPKSTTTVSDDP